MDGSLNVENWWVVGIGPERRLCDKLKWFNEVIEDMLGGMRPERRFHERSRVSSLCMAPIIRGIFPVNWSWNKFKVPKVERFVIPFGISPHKLLLEISIKYLEICFRISYIVLSQLAPCEQSMLCASRHFLSNRITEVKAVKLAKHCWMDPDKLLSARSKMWR